MMRGMMIVFLVLGIGSSAANVWAQPPVAMTVPPASPVTSNQGTWAVSSSHSLADPRGEFHEQDALQAGPLAPLPLTEPSPPDVQYFFSEPQPVYSDALVTDRRRWQWGDSVVAPRGPAAGPWWQAMGRGYYVNDQRWEFSGQEATFGVEGILLGGFSKDYGAWRMDLGGELYLNQPFDDNILVDAPVREDYKPNFLVDTLELSQLALGATTGDWQFTFGKVVTPFGRTYFPLLSNSRWDAPFIRSEAILWRETGFVIDWSPGPWEISAALTNGSEDRDTNSSKAFISRVGWQSDHLVVGASLKEQDGIGSEGQKYYNSHVGMDFAWRWGRWTWAGEIIHDKYGYRRPGFAPNQIDWGRSLYHRDLHLATLQPITGWGYYSGVLYEQQNWLGWLSYGQFLPQAIGDPIHDHGTHRFLGKCVGHLNPNLDAFVVVLLENSIEVGQDGYPRHGTSLLVGFQGAL